MNRQWFDQQLGRMMPLRGFPSDSDGYWDVLADTPESDLERGVGYALRSRAWFPAPSELLADIETSKPKANWPASRVQRTPTRYTAIIPNPFGGKSITIQVDEERGYDCERCSDGGWESMWCGPTPPKPWMKPATCGRNQCAYQHEWVRKCSCWDSNPTLLQKRAYAAQQAASRTAKTERS